MVTQVILAQGGLQGVNPQAQDALREVLVRYANDIVDEAGRLESALHTAGGPPEITSSMIKDADLLLRRGYSRPRKPLLTKVSQIVAAVGGFGTGLLANGDKLKEPPTLLLFVVVIAVTITATVVAIIKE